MNVLQKIICKLFQITPEVKYVDKVIEKKVYIEKPYYVTTLPKNSICLQGICEIEGKIGVDK